MLSAICHLPSALRRLLALACAFVLSQCAPTPAFAGAPRALSIDMDTGTVTPASATGFTAPNFAGLKIGGVSVSNATTGNGTMHILDGSLTISGAGQVTSFTEPSDIMSLSTEQTVTGAKTFSGNVTVGGIALVLPTGAIVGTTDTQTLEHKTLTSPTITGATLTSATITAISITQSPDPALTTLPAHNKYLTTDSLRLALAHMSCNEFRWGDDGGSVLVGSGNTTGGVLVRQISTGTTASSMAGWYSNLTPWSANPGATRSADWNWGKVVVAAQRFLGVSGGLSTNAVFSTTIGSEGAGAGPLSAAGIGFGLVSGGGTNGALVIYAHNGTALTTTSTGATVDLSNSFVHEVILVSDGTGNVHCYLDGTFITTGTGGPTANAGTGYPLTKIENFADTTNNGIAISSLRVWISQ